MDYYQDFWGTYRFIGSDRELDLNDLIARGIDVVGAWSSHSPYVSPDDPRYQQRGGYPQQYGFPNQSPNYSPVSVNTQGFQMPWWAILGIGVLAFSFVAGRRR